MLILADILEGTLLILLQPHSNIPVRFCTLYFRVTAYHDNACLGTGFCKAGIGGKVPWIMSLAAACSRGMLKQEFLHTPNRAIAGLVDSMRSSALRSFVAA